MPTIYDVAEHAGVSISTVSLALNKPERVAKKTLHKVLAAVEELGFVPKAEAASRARKGTRRVGVVGAFTAYTSFVERLRGVIAEAGASGFEVVVYDEESAALKHHLVDSLPLSTKLDGLILMSVPISDSLARRLADGGLETVLIEFPRSGFSLVTVDDEEGGRAAAEYLVGRGHTRCAFLGEEFVGGTAGEEFVTTQAEHRLRGFRKGLTEAGLGLPATHVVNSRHSVAHAREAMRQLLQIDPAPTAVFAHSDLLAVGALKEARSLGLNVPDDVAVMGFDDCEFAEHLDLTTVRQPLFESGKVAMRLLRDRIADGPGALTQTVNLALQIVPRSTA